MATFPKLSTGAVAQYPFTVRTTFRTAVQHFLDGTDQRFREFQSPVKRWIIQLDRLTAEEAAAVEEFFWIENGRQGLFAFTDPSDGVEYPDCRFDHDSLAADWHSETRTITSVVIRNTKV